jgi:FMN phosphatase YigB (HAD superfamily)
MSKTAVRPLPVRRKWVYGRLMPLEIPYPVPPGKPVRFAGFDMDGTLYDEFDFIRTAYAGIADLTDGRGAFLADPAAALRFMLSRWLEKGSGYPHVFDEAHALHGRGPAARDAFITAALSCFRDAAPVLTLPPRTAHVLSVLSGRSEDVTLFLISDGNPALQRRKAAALGLARFFPPESMIFTGDFGRPKPAPDAVRRLPFALRPDETVFFGDRDKDEGFARAAGCRFVRLHAGFPVSEP